MIAADLYEGIREAEGRDATGVAALLRGLSLEGFTLPFPPEDASLHLDNTFIVEREGKVSDALGRPRGAAARARMHAIAHLSG